MSTVRRTQVRCDGFRIGTDRGENMDGFFGQCSYWLEEDKVGSHSAAAEREKAAQAGWTRQGTKDLCPSCTTRFAPVPAGV